MDALLLALLLGLLLDQGDRSQRLVHRLGDGAQNAKTGIISLVCLIVIVGAVGSAILGLAIAPYLAGRAGQLFFAITLLFGAFGLVLSARSNEPATSAAPLSAGRLLGELLLYRLVDRSSFLLIGIVALTGNAWATALGGAIGGLGALLPPLIAGGQYERALWLNRVRPAIGGVLLLAGAGYALSALGLY